MKRYIKVVLAIAFILLVCTGAAAAVRSILINDFEPVAVCAGEETYAAAERLKNNWCISVLKHDGTLLHDISFSANDTDNNTELYYANSTYYFRTTHQIETDKNITAVYQISSENSKKEIPQTQLQTNNDEEIGSININNETISIVGWHNESDKTVMSVYLAGKDSNNFSKKLKFSLPQIYLIRNAYYKADGTVIFLTASGRIYEISKSENYPDLLYDGSQAPAKDFSLDKEGKTWLFDCNEETLHLTDSYTAEPGLESLDLQLSYKFPEINLSKCQEISLISDNRAAVLFLDKKGDWNLGLYQNEMLNVINSISHYPHWIFVLVFIIIAVLLGSILFLLIFGIWYFFGGTFTMQKRLCIICTATAAAVLTVISVNVYLEYTNQKENQDWERLTITLNNADIYFELNNQNNLNQLVHTDWDNDIQIVEDNELIQRLWTFSDSDSSNAASCLLFISDEGVMKAISGTSMQIGKRPDQIYDRKTVQKLCNTEIKEGDLISGTYIKDGISWMYLAKPIFNDNKEKPAGLLIMQIPSAQWDEPLILAADLLLFIAVAGFMLILIMRIRYALRPLHQMELQARKFTTTGICDPIHARGHNEITVLTWRFQQAVSELKRSMSQSQRNADSYGRFVDKELISLIGKENLSALHIGDYTEIVLPILEMRFVPYEKISAEDEYIYQYQSLYSCILPVIRKNNGIAENLSAEKMRFLFPGSCFNAICAASAVRENIQGKFQFEAVIDYGKTAIQILGDDEHMRICSEMQNESVRMKLLYQKCREFGCQILMTEDAVQAIPDFRAIFNSRTIGFFPPQQKNEELVRLVEILPQQCSDTFERAVRLYQTGSYAEAFNMFFSASEKNPADRAAKRYMYLCNEALKETGKRGIL